MMEGETFHARHGSMGHDRNVMGTSVPQKDATRLFYHEIYSLPNSAQIDPASIDMFPDYFCPDIRHNVFKILAFSSYLG